MTHSLSLALIVKNEETNLQRCLSSVEGVFDEIVVVDTGSADGTKEVAKRFGAKIFDFQWTDDFAAARNFSFSKASSDYIMWLDADDEILPNDRNKLCLLKSSLTADAYIMTYDYAQDGQGSSLIRLLRHRIVKRDVATWTYPIHECMSLRADATEAITDIVVTHKRSAADTVRDKGRNIRILERAIFAKQDDQRLLFYYAKELFTEGRFLDSLMTFDKYFARSTGGHDDINGRIIRALCHRGLGQHKATIEECLQGIKIDPRFAEFYVIIGQTHYAHNSWQQAISWFEMATRCRVPNTYATILYDHYTWVPFDFLCMCYGQLDMARESYDANEAALRYRPTDERLLKNREFLRDNLFQGRSDQVIRLSVGSGGKVTEGYRLTDAFPGPGVTEVFDQTSVPYRDASVQSIYSEHSLEHVGHKAAEQAIAEWSRVLRPGGDLILKIPDLELCCYYFLQANDEKPAWKMHSQKEWYKYTIYGIQDVTDDPNPGGQYHKTGFTKASISNLLVKHGFKVIGIINYDGFDTPSLEVRAVKS